MLCLRGFPSGCCLSLTLTSPLLNIVVFNTDSTGPYTLLPRSFMEGNKNNSKWRVKVEVFFVIAALSDCTSGHIIMSPALSLNQKTVEKADSPTNRIFFLFSRTHVRSSYSSRNITFSSLPCSLPVILFAFSVFKAGGILSVFAAKKKNHFEAEFPFTVFSAAQEISFLVCWRFTASRAHLSQAAKHLIWPIMLLIETYLHNFAFYPQAGGWVN